MLRLYFNTDHNHTIFDMDSYSKFVQLGIDTARNEIQGHTPVEANKVIYNKILEVMGLPEKPTRREVHAAMRSTAKREAYYEILSTVVENAVITGWGQNPFFNQFVEIKRGDLGDTNEFYVEDNTDLIVSQVASSNHDIIRQRLGAGNLITPTIKAYGAKVYMEAERYLMGAEDWATLINALAKAFTNKLSNTVYAAFTSAASALTPSSQWVISGPMTTASHAAMIQLISDVQVATGSPAMIMGTKVGLSGLGNVGSTSWIAEEAKNDVYRTGKLGWFEGTPVVEIPQAFAPGDTASYLVSDTVLYIMPQTVAQFVKLYFEGDTEVYEVMDRMTHVDHTFDYEMVMKWGTAVVLNSRFGKFTITTG